MGDNKEEISVHCNPLSIPNHISKTFNGYRRSDGRVGTANYWLFIPTVFCENRNLDVIKEAMLTELGYASSYQYSLYTRQLLQAYQDNERCEAVSFNPVDDCNPNRVFKNVDGIKFLNHSGGCGGTRQDSALLSSLLAAYADHPNVGGITILSLGCQHLQIDNLVNDLKKRNPGFDKPIYIFEQQQIKSEEQLIASALRQTFSGLIEINKLERESFPLNQLCVGIVADKGVPDISSLSPSIGYAADLLVTIGCKVLLRSSRKISFRQTLVQAAFEKDKVDGYPQRIPVSENYGIIQEKTTINSENSDTSRLPVADLLDYSSPVELSGLSLVRSSANTGEAITSIVASGATVVLFQTNNLYPKGNPVVPVITIATEFANVNHQDSISDIDTSLFDCDKKTEKQIGEKILQFCIDVASARTIPKAVQLMQEDFIPIRTGVSL